MTPAEAVALIPRRDLVVFTTALNLAVQVLCDNVAIGGQPEWEGMRKAWNLILEMQQLIGDTVNAGSPLQTPDILTAMELEVAS